MFCFIINKLKRGKTEMNRKGAELTVGTIVIIVLAVIVLVILVLGFTGGWGNLWSRISGIFGSGANIDTVIQSCQVACATESQNDYCVVDRKVVLESKQKLTPASCMELSVLQPSLGIGECDAIDCDLKCEGEAGWNGEWMVTQNCDTAALIDEEDQAKKEAFRGIPDELIADKADNPSDVCCVIKDKI